MSWHYLQEEVAVSWPHQYLDGAPFALLKLIPEQDKSCSTDKKTALSSDSQFGMTSKHLTQSLGEILLTSSRVDSRAKTSAYAEQAKALQAHDQDCGQRWRVAFASFDQDLSLWKIRQCSLFEDLEQSLETWPEWGWMHDGECFEHQQSEQRIIEPGFTWLLTPTAQSWKAWTFRNPLALIRKNHADGNLQEQLMRLFQRMTTPTCQEILMMWPEGWTDSKPLEMAGFQRWLHEQSQHFCTDNEK